MKKYLFGVVALLVIIWVAVQYWPVTVRVSGGKSFSLRMPWRDKKRLDYFFRDVCFLNAWAYTLLGSKPMSVHQYTKPWVAFQNIVRHSDLTEILLQCFWPPDFHEICYLFNPEQIKIKRGWETLNKYISRLPSRRFCLFACDRGGVVVLTILDKAKIVGTVNRYSDDFHELLKVHGIQSEDLLDDGRLRSFIGSIQTDGFIGTLLGYGRDNAWLFQKCKEMNLSPQQRPMVGLWEEEDQEHLAQLCRKCRSLQPWDLTDLYYPSCVCDPNSEETKQLKQTYREERAKITQYYENKDIVEATLSLFNQP